MRGAEKKVIHLKNTGSQLFSEAYFIVNNDKGTPPREIKDMISEADRIIDRSISDRGAEGREGRKILGFFVHFFIGAFLTLALTISIVALF